MNLLDRFSNAVDRASKTRTLKVLRGLSEEQLRDVGISRQLLAEGVRAWPWRAMQDNRQPRKPVFKIAVGKVGQVDVTESINFSKDVA